MGTALAARRKSLAALVKNMSPALKSIFEDISNSFRSFSERNLLFYHAFGTKIKKIHDEEKIEKYGTQPIPRLALALGMSERTLWSAMQFCREYTIADVKKISEIPGPHGQCAVHWSHMIALMPVADHEQRNALIKLIADNLWTVEELREELQRRAVRRLAKKPGLVAVPSTAMSGLKQVATVMDKVLNRQHDVWTHVFTMVNRISSDECSDALLSQVSTTLEMQQSMHKAVSKNIEVLVSAKSRMEKLIAKKAEISDNGNGKK